ncbi:MAG: VgrG-related protein [Actinomycetales bacterium]|nr:VgrG-related protein [Actinomycetales bacterium]
MAADLYPRLRLVRVEESVQLPDAFTIRIDDPHFELMDAGTFTLGTTVEIAFRAESDPLVVTEGEVTAIGVEPGLSGRHELVVSGLDRGHRLARSIRTRSFQHMSDAAIVRQIAGEYGLDVEAAAGGPTHDYVLQAGQTDYAFLLDRAVRLGYDLWVTGSTLHFAPKPKAEGTPPALRWGDNLRSFRVRFSAAERCDEVVVHGWDGVGKRAVTGRATEGDPGCDAPAVERMTAAARRAFGKVTRETGRGGIPTQAEADALAASLMHRASGAGVVLRGEAFGDPRIAAGATVRIERVGQELAGSYLLSSVEHCFGSDQPYVTRFVSGARDPAALVDLTSGSGAAARGTSTNPAGHSLLVGEVTNNDDPDGLGRVKVRFPTLSADDESTWARLVTPGAGKSRGMQWLPEVGDEVLAAFAWGDVHRPVVLGGLWNRSDPPPESAPVKGGQTTTRLLASRKDHRIELVDDPTSSVEIRLGDAACRLHLEQSETSLEGEQKVVVSGQEIEVTATSKLVLTAPQVEISADSALTLSGQPIKLN